jgi:hypothetical protein
VYRFAHALIDSGADVIFGNGPHVARAIEVYRERFIAYSLGNFCTYGRFILAYRNNLAPIVKLRLDVKGRFLSGWIVPAVQPSLGGVTYDPDRLVIKKLLELSDADFPDSPVKITEEGNILYKLSHAIPGEKN